MIKQQLRKAAKKMATWPLVGRFVRIGVAVIRLPNYRDAFLDLNHRRHVFETEQLPRLLQTISDLNHRLLASNNDKENLVKSVPVALRKITRDLIELRHQLETVSSSINQRSDERCMQLDTVSNSEIEQIKAKTEIINP